MEFTHEFSAPIAKVGISSRDGRVLARDGEFKVMPGAPVLHGSSGTVLALLEGAPTWEIIPGGMAMRVYGLAFSKTFADVLGGDDFRLEIESMDFESVSGVIFERIVIRTARVVKAQDWNWA